MAGEDVYDLIRAIQRAGYATEWHPACPGNPWYRIMATQEDRCWSASDADALKAVRLLMQQLGITEDAG